MKTFYKWLDIFLNVLLILPLVGMSLSFRYISWLDLFMNSIDQTSSFLVALSIFSSIITIVIGIILFILAFFKKKKAEKKAAFMLILKGFIRLIIPYIFIYLSLFSGFAKLTF